MIAFDNGPADGDYVRYIDALVKASISTSATTLGSNAAVPMRTSNAAPMTVATDGRLESDATLRTRGLDPTVRRAEMKTAATAALASAMVRRAGATDVVDLAALGKAALTVIAGLVLGIIGVFMHPSSVLVIAAGIAIVVAGVRSVSRNAAAMTRPKPRLP